MILARMAQAVKRQDWVQVTIEVLIVVIGIFLGLQVQAWYDGRLAVEEEERVVGYLINDIENTISNLERAGEGFNRVIQSEITLLQLLEQDTLLEKDIQNFEYAVFIITKNPPIEGFFNGFTEDNIAKIQDERLKRIIGGYLDRKNDEFNLVEMLYQVRFLFSVEETLRKALVSEETSIGKIKNYDFDQLKNDNDYKRAIGHIISDTTVLKKIVQRLLNNSKNMHRVLKIFQTGGEIEEVEFMQLEQLLPS